MKTGRFFDAIASIPSVQRAQCRCFGQISLLAACVLAVALFALPASAQSTGHGDDTSHDAPSSGYDGSDGPGILGPSAFGPVAPPSDPSKEVAALKRMEVLAKWLDREVSQCTTKEIDCIADALEVYARELRAVPVAQSNIPVQASAIVLEASRKIRRSASRQQAVEILDEAVRKVDQIRLVRSDDIVIGDAIQGQQRAVEVALTSTRSTLARAVEL